MYFQHRQPNYLDFWFVFFDLNTRTVLSEPPDTMYFGFDQSQSWTLSSWPIKSYSGAFELEYKVECSRNGWWSLYTTNLLMSHNFTWLSYDPEMNKCSSVVDQQTVWIHCVCPRYVFLTTAPSANRKRERKGVTGQGCKDLKSNDFYSDNNLRFERGSYRRRFLSADAVMISPFK